MKSGFFLDIAILTRKTIVDNEPTSLRCGSVELWVIWGNEKKNWPSGI